jgi:hypothetical protein
MRRPPARGPCRPHDIRMSRSCLPPVAALISIALTILLTLCSAPLQAGTICGHVRDADTGGPIDRAGVFVQDPGGGYTGYHGATDATGSFCIDGVPPGTYDLSVQVDDYQIAWLSGVVVEDSMSDVILDAVLPPLWLWPPWPNPAVGQINLRLRSRLAAPLTLAVFDVAGRLVHGWRADAGPVTERTLVWDGRDQRGRRVPAGRYFVMLRSGDVSLTRPVLILR